MDTLLPDYAPPHSRRAAVAVGLAPFVVLLAFTLIVCGLIDADTGFAVFVACTAWIVVELYRYQKTLEGYDLDYAQQHLAWRSSALPRDGQMR